MMFQYSTEMLVEMALAEDRVFNDCTSLMLLEHDRTVLARAICKQDGVLSGCGVFALTFHKVSSQLQVTMLKNDGQQLQNGEIIAKISGAASAILRAERVALNFLQHLSGIATMTRRTIALLEGTATSLLDTRKTTPGMRMLEKKAVRDGGGRNHRCDLASMVLIKDNHIELAGSITSAVNAIRAKSSGLLLEVEVKNLDELREALELEVDWIMLDNFAGSEIRAAVELNRNRAKLELSGGVTPEKINTGNLAGIDYLSMGALTHSAAALDISLEICNHE